MPTPPVMPTPVTPVTPPTGTRGDAERVFEQTIRTIEAEADNDPELKELMRNLRRMMDANGGDPAAAPSPSRPPAPRPGMAAGCPSPSYPVSALRWERFPIRVYIEEVDLTRRGYSEQRKAEIVRLIMQGLGSWAAATGGRVGSVTHVEDFRGADLNIVFRNGTGNTIHDGVQGSVIRHATIMWDVDRWEAFGDKDHRIVNGMAHEMGHVLGITAHPETPGTLMVDGPEQLTFTGPQSADVAAILAKYGSCR
jgi:hypothetical protein